MNPPPWSQILTSLDQYIKEKCFSQVLSITHSFLASITFTNAFQDLCLLLNSITGCVPQNLQWIPGSPPNISQWQTLKLTIELFHCRRFVLSFHYRRWRSKISMLDFDHLCEYTFIVPIPWTLNVTRDSKISEFEKLCHDWMMKTCFCLWNFLLCLPYRICFSITVIQRNARPPAMNSASR
jgi:hypothetical protein